MSFDLDTLRGAVLRHGRVARVVVADVAGSTPREVGAAMLVWAEGDGIGQSGTIGGGELELQAAKRGLASPFVERIPLGPSLGQCCGGAVTLLCEHFDEATLGKLNSQQVRACSLTGTDMPLAVKRLISQARNQGRHFEPHTLQGWFVEPINRPRAPLWIYGAGHVGRAIVSVLAPLDQFEITWVDTGPARFPDSLPDGVIALPTPHPERAAAIAPDHARHLVLTFSHALDLALCHAILSRSFASVGLIGSATKWARFRARLAAMGHAQAQISRIICPIGDPSLGKAPQAIAVGVAAALLKDAARREGNHGQANRGQVFDDTGDDRECDREPGRRSSEA
ncbi:xanthine dehydrogenase accessory protein XdhC [Aliiroseovarius sp.]|uniref:xanthine dehydrogenase accessory protein XdhC n=1 Tax=Aliiroseovarius sp. TaxID=1872442 RepID=UPI002610458F|nr:xanthine dehydrogenase accessory protein XdhC [Aliiroseovarius sp.]